MEALDASGNSLRCRASKKTCACGVATRLRGRCRLVLEQALLPFAKDFFIMSVHSNNSILMAVYSWTKGGRKIEYQVGHVRSDTTRFLERWHGLIPHPRCGVVRFQTQLFSSPGTPLLALSTPRSSLECPNAQPQSAQQQSAPGVLKPRVHNPRVSLECPTTEYLYPDRVGMFTKLPHQVLQLCCNKYQPATRLFLNHSALLFLTRACSFLKRILPYAPVAQHLHLRPDRDPCTPQMAQTPVLVRELENQMACPSVSPRKLQAVWRGFLCGW